jgi:hypothetical protein
MPRFITPAKKYRSNTTERLFLKLKPCESSMFCPQERPLREWRYAAAKQHTVGGILEKIGLLKPQLKCGFGAYMLQ